MSQTPLGSSQLQLSTHDSAGGNPPLTVAIEIEPQPTHSCSVNHLPRGIPQSLLFAVAIGTLCLLNLMFGAGLVTMAELERHGLVVPNLSNYSLTLVLVPYCTWIMTSVALHFVLLRCFSDIAPHCRGEELRSLRRMLLRCVDGFMLIPVLMYFVIRVFLSKDSATFYASSGIIARTAMMTGMIIEFSELTTYSTRDWTLAAHHMGELIVTLLCIEWVPGVGGRESALFILTLLTAFDRCAYPYFFLSKLRFLREKHYPSTTARSLHSVHEKSTEPIALSTTESQQATPQPESHDKNSAGPTVLLKMSDSTLRLLARATFAYYAVFVRLLVLTLLVAHLILKKDTMLLGWQIALIPAFVAFAAVDIPVYLILWKRSQ